ncbi:type II secretion system F family protein [Acidovorax sp. Be4]|uniref:Type II secretion system F family protein n=1 Tax=Acidovorax bellezanensis TaxID=2976702 RepID=A0ABT2PS84_9BURK|nr:type II secretion system F family protein [Acidovorax sp. Be4]MCT9813078.1 type II secretion system F family protein [Acidovorax sp. Be4]
MTAQQLLTLSLALAALGASLLVGVLIWREFRSARAEARVGEVLQAREASAAVMNPFPMPSAQPLSTSPASIKAEAAMAQSVANSMKPPPWLNSRVAKALFADEDRQLIEQAGIEVATGGLTYVISRVVLCLLLPMLALLLLQPTGIKALMYGFFAFGLGVMLPKWVIRSKASKRRTQVVEELPLFMDLLRLLQGVGLSIDQSLQILATEFGSVLRVISAELALANRLYSSGRSREQSLQRLSVLGADDDMSAVVNLLVQVDRHGGAVQEPLKEFSIRLREKRQAGFKEKIGAITVKMTGVMVLTLLPALIVITAGPGFTAVIRSLSAMGG